MSRCITNLSIKIALFALVSANAFALGNPASLFCKKQGGITEILYSNKGDQTGFCQLDGASIDEWTLISSAEGGKKMDATEVFLRHPGLLISSQDAATSYCKGLKGKIRTLVDSQKKSHILCDFDDRSSIDTWTLFRGPTAAENQKLVHLLK